ncbi:hypothetical protein MKL37_17675 [Acinetobacter sp. AOR11_HL]|uniref:hypothetical protein n=1 Tax=Acinetobacter sp. AOR11_HL TaxID=2919377 RepID=UPI0022EB0A73|nr:hypothetical protein [Acinetobacter sp. AOR11_HL]MDA3552179.1 hypothetical protein [Acinetobacter sp. AOR11_HL]
MDKKSRNLELEKWLIEAAGEEMMANHLGPNWNKFNEEFGFYPNMAMTVADLVWQHHQAKVEELQKQVQFLEQELGAWKGKSIAAMVNGMCKQCGKEPLQAIVSDKDGYALLHCFGCGANKYELVGEQALKVEGQ